MDHSSFCQLLKFCWPSLLEQDIPHQHALCGEILWCADIAEGRVRDNLKRVSLKFSFTFNAWTSTPGDPYLSLTCHFIDAPADRPNAWVLNTDQLIFEEIQGWHTGKNMADILSHALDRYNLRGKVSSHLTFLSISLTTELFHWLGNLLSRTLYFTAFNFLPFVSRDCETLHMM